jgi:hypothetical protein
VLVIILSCFDKGIDEFWFHIYMDEGYNHSRGVLRFSSYDIAGVSSR